MAEEDLQVEIGGEQLVLGHLLALVVGEGFEQGRRDVIEFTREGRAHVGSVFFREMAEEGEARGALNQHADRGLVPRTKDQVWESKGPVARVFGIISMALGGYLQGSGRTRNNPGFDMIQKILRA